MTSDRQIAANRLNAQNSTGPRTDHGKRRSRRNAFRHGLTAETVIDTLENAADYDALAAAINADFRPRTNFELELVARLVSLLWRMRRAVAIESGLMDIQAKSLRKRRAMNGLHYNNNRLSLFYALAPTLAPQAIDSDQPGLDLSDTERNAERLSGRSFKSEIARSFIRGACLDNDVFERLGHHETRLWRQVVQIILLLNSVNRGSKDYADCDNKYFRLGTGVAKHRRAFWPPFIPSN
jgi:hypothetical protein